MLRPTAYDTVCHEHLEYYSLAHVRRILDEAGSGSSTSVSTASTAAASPSPPRTSSRRSFRTASSSTGSWDRRRGWPRHARPVSRFEERVFRHRTDLAQLVHALRADGASIMGYGASTKGNVLLQFCGLRPPTSTLSPT